MFCRVCSDACNVGVVFVVVVLELDVWLYVYVVAGVEIGVGTCPYANGGIFCVMIVLIEPGVASSRIYDTLLLFLYGVFIFRK